MSLNYLHTHVHSTTGLLGGRNQTDFRFFSTYTLEILGRWNQPRDTCREKLPHHLLNKSPAATLTVSVDDADYSLRRGEDDRGAFHQPKTEREDLWWLNRQVS